MKSKQDEKTVDARLRLKGLIFTSVHLKTDVEVRNLEEFLTLALINSVGTFFKRKIPSQFPPDADTKAIFLKDIYWSFIAKGKTFTYEMSGVDTD